MNLKRKHYLLLLLALIAGGGAAVAFNRAYSPPVPVPQPIIQPTSTKPIKPVSPVPLATGCDPTLWLFVYHPTRLPTKDDCRTVRGVVKWEKHEPDGDFHIRLLLDDPNAAPVNASNMRGLLVVEPICQTDGMPVPTQADAVPGCAEYVANHKPQWKMPNVGDHIQVSGFYTEDLQHGWEELHAVSHLNLIP